MHSDSWIAVGLESQIQPSSSNPAVVGGQALAVWRGENGPVNVWEDRCPHRGMRLSFGFVRGDTLRCIYHGWGYATDGQCTTIPAHPDLKPPKTICANAFPAESRYVIVWTNLSKSPSAPPADFGPDEGWAPVRTVYLARGASEAGGVIDAIKTDFGYGTRAVLYGMAVALFLALIAALFHPGTRVTDPDAADEPAGADDDPAAEPTAAA